MIEPPHTAFRLESPPRPCDHGQRAGRSCRCKWWIRGRCSPRLRSGGTMPFVRRDGGGQRRGIASGPPGTPPAVAAMARVTMLSRASTRCRRRPRRSGWAKTRQASLRFGLAQAFLGRREEVQPIREEGMRHPDSFIRSNDGLEEACFVSVVPVTKQAVVRNTTASVGRWIGDAVIRTRIRAASAGCCLRWRRSGRTTVRLPT